MNAILQAEAAKVRRDLFRITQQGSISEESPIRIHSRDTDAGGAPELHEKFIRWVGRVCFCSRPATCASGCRAGAGTGMGHLADCDPGCPPDSGRFRASNHKSSATRLKRALRQLRQIDPKAHDAMYLLTVLGMGWHDALAKMNDSNVTRGKPEYSEADFVVLTLAGGSLLAASY